MAFTPSVYQQAIFDWADDVQRKGIMENLLIEAVAGSGKSTSLIELIARLKGRVLVLAFNKHIVEEFKRMLAVRGVYNVDVMTNHGLGNRAIYRGIGPARLDDKKYDVIAKAGMSEGNWKDKTFRFAVLKLVDLARMTLTDVRDRKALEELVFHYDIDVNGGLEAALDLVPLVVNEGRKLTAVIDFCDMIWLPNVLQLPVPKYDWVLIDEAQDLSRAQQELVISAGSKGRVICVGDRRQAIMGFAGADTNSIPRLIDALKAKTLPLSICYRCPASHVRRAKEIVPQIEAKPNAIEGEIKEASYNEALAVMADKDMVVCRINAPLAKIALTLITNGTKAMIRGRDIGKGLINLLDKHAKGDDFEAQLDALNAYGKKECLRLERLGKETQAESLADRIETIWALADGITTMGALQGRIENIFADERSGVVCSSIHRAKGLEAERVFLYRPDLLDGFIRKAKSAEAKMQESNLKYVALTRSKSSLWLVDEDPKSREERERKAALRDLERGL